MTNYRKIFSDQEAYVARRTALLDARDVLITNLGASPRFPAGATLEMVYPRSGPTYDNRVLENGSAKPHPAMFAGKIVGAEPGEVTSVKDIRDLAAEIGVAVPGLVAK